MSISVIEKLESREFLKSRDGKSSTFDMTFVVRGTMDSGEAEDAVNSFAPGVWGSGIPILWKQNVRVRNIGENLWEAFVHYDTSGPEPLAADDSFAFELDGGSQHITQALATTAYGAAPNQFGAIGVTESGVEGADVYSPGIYFEETHWLPQFSTAYKLTLIDLHKHVNASPFKGLQAGEVLFDGVSARKQDNRFGTPWSVTYRFRVERNAIVAVGSITGIAKQGWQLLDIRYEKVAGAASILSIPTGVYVHTVYPYGNFALLNIG